jgi:hypothetical protein
LDGGFGLECTYRAYFIAFEGTILCGVQLAGLFVMESIVDCLSSMWNDPSVFVQVMVERD